MTKDIRATRKSIRLNRIKAQQKIKQEEQIQDSQDDRQIESLQKKQKDCSSSQSHTKSNSKHPTYETTLKKNQKTKQVCHSKQSKCCNIDNQQESKVLWSTANSTRRLLAIGEHILDFSEYVQKRVLVFKSVELHPNNPKLGFIRFTGSASIKRLEKMLLKSGIKNLQVCAVERMNGWKDFFKHPNIFFPDYQHHPIKSEYDNNNNNNPSPNDFAKQQQSNNLILNDKNTIVQSKQNNIPNKMLSQQINIKQEVDDCSLNINEEGLQASSYLANESVYEKYEQQLAPNLILNSNSNLNNNLYLNKNSNLNNSIYTQQPQSTIFNSSSSINNHIPNSQQHIENKIYVEIIQILRRNRKWGNLLELFRYIELSKWISSTKKAQMLFAIGEKRGALENILQLNELYGQEQDYEVNF